MSTDFLETACAPRNVGPLAWTSNSHHLLHHLHRFTADLLVGAQKTAGLVASAGVMDGWYLVCFAIDYHSGTDRGTTSGEIMGVDLEAEFGREVEEAEGLDGSLAVGLFSHF